MNRIYVPAALLLLAASALMIARLSFGGVRIDSMRPVIKYYVTLQMEASLHGESANIKTYLPPSGERQTVEKENVESSHLAYSLARSGPNRRAVWSARGVTGHELATYNATVAIHAKRYEIPDGIAIPKSYPPSLTPYLQPTETIQSDSEEIISKAREIVETSGAEDLASVIRALYVFVRDDVDGSDYENTLDALTTLKWREAFCGGKSRLLVAMLRSVGIPARMIGGLILTSGSKRVSHAWLEAWVNGVWVPMDALNDHFAEHPANYLILYYGDQVLFSRTANINFQYHFNIRRWRTPPDENLDPATASFLNPYAFWHAFDRAHISLNLLRIVLLLPVGVLVVVLFRNVIGLTMFGTFHPALMAAAFRETGFLWGAGLYCALLLLGLALRRALDHVELLHTPRLSILLVFVVGFMLAVTYLSATAGAFEPAHMSLFPIAILAITVESFFRTTSEHGPAQALLVMLQTLVVVGVVFMLIESYRVQAVVFVFPEVIIGVVAASLALGRWTGMRLTEYGRFRWLLVD